jgi:hypothetical protein
LELALATREFGLVIALVEEGLRTWPGNSALLGAHAFALQARGHLNEADRILSGVKFDSANVDSGSLALMYQTLLRRDSAGASKFLDSHPQAAEETNPLFLPYWASVQEAAGRKDAARATFTRVRDAVEPLLQSQPQNAGFVAILAFALAGLDQRDAAIKAVDQFAALSVGDARSAGPREELSARVFARFGDKERAISSLERLLSAPADGLFGAPVTPAILRLDPAFDLLHDDPRFQQLSQEPSK